MEERIIGRVEGGEPGPLLICIGGMHGNEPAGISAIEEVFRLLDKEHLQNPGFRYHGILVGIRGNLQSIRQKKRFITRDLNRMLLAEEIRHIQSLSASERTVEEQECIELLTCIEDEKAKYPNATKLILDLHTTTAGGGIFSIADDDPVSLMLAKGLHVPIILGIARGLKGTTLDYFHRPSESMYCLVFEAGQHEDPESVYRTVSAILNCMRSIGAVQPNDVDYHHDGLLQGLSLGLPKVTRLVYHYKIHPGESFTMRPGFKNFDVVKEGDILAENEKGVITSPCDGLVLMPKYQPQGDDGFFLVEKVE